jgi:membrane protease YdiL (CAAX protease family)
MGKCRKEILTFLGLTFLLSAGPYSLIISSGSLSAGGGWYPIALMWCPGFAALITSLVYNKNLRGFGWGWGDTRYQASAYLIPILYALVAYGSVWLLGLGGIDDSFSRNWLSWLAFGTLLGCFAALGEEIGWRGFLVPRLAGLTSFTNVSLISGAIWAVWHMPLILFADYNGGTPGWYSLTCFTVMVVASSFVYAWLRLKSRSVWTAMLFHASHNFWIQGFFNPLTTDLGATKYFIGEFGAALAIVSVILAYLFWQRRHLLPAPRYHSGKTNTG